MTKQLAHQTLQQLIDQLLESPNAASLPNDKIIQVITEVIESEYKSCRKSLRQDFYKDLSRLLHSDRLAGSSQYRRLATYLKERGLIDAPQRILIEYHTDQSATPILSFFKEIFIRPSQSLDMLKRRATDNPLLTNLERYPDLFKPGILLLVSVLSVTILLFPIFSQLISGITRSLINKINEFVNTQLNKITDDKYEEMSFYYKTANFAEYKKQFLVEAKIQLQNEALLDEDNALYAAINVMDDADFWDYLLSTIQPIDEEPANSSAQELVNERIKKLTLSTLDRIGAAFFAFYAAGTNKNNPLLQRGRLLVTSPFAMAVVIFGEAVSLAQKGFFAAVDTAFLVLYYAAVTTLNAPLFSYDVSVFLFEYILDKDIVEHEVKATKVQKTPLYLLFSQPKNSDELSSDKQPIHMSSPIQALTPLVQADVDEPLEMTPSRGSMQN